ncbi:MAG TPA: hypothetical protein VK892_20115 [Pyrinomonadaceae bacterium]|nr:hypothetical protein [Pyrinomonadaceae bacterium]
MAEDKDKTAYIGIERAENSLKYIAKVFDKPPREITKQQYNAIVKALGAQDWRNSEEDELNVINRVINSQLNPT